MSGGGRVFAPVLTVSVAACNVERYIGACLNSLCDYRFLGRVEVFVIDDGGTDGTMRTAKIYANRLPGVFTLVHKENEGWGSTVNYSIRHAHGRYFRILDGDDLVDPEALEAELQVLEETDADLVYTPHREFFDAQESSVRVTEQGNEKVPGQVGFPGTGPWKKTKGKNWTKNLANGLFRKGSGRAEEQDANVSPVGCEGGVMGEKGWEEPAPAEGLYRVEEVIGWMDLAMHNATWKTSLLRQYVEIPNHCFYTDTEYMLEAMHHCGSVYLLHRAVYLYRKGREGQSTSAEGLRRHRKDHLHMIEDLLQYMTEEGMLRGGEPSAIRKTEIKQRRKSAGWREENVYQGKAGGEKSCGESGEGLLRGRAQRAEKTPEYAIGSVERQALVDRKLVWSLSGNVMGQYKQEMFFGPGEPYREELRLLDERMRLSHPELVRMRWKCGVAAMVLRLPLGRRAGYRMLCRAVKMMNRRRGWYK